MPQHATTYPLATYLYVPILDYCLVELLWSLLIAIKLNLLPAQIASSLLPPIGLTVALLLPGYILTTILFPLHTDLTFLGRGALSIGLSLALLAVALIPLDWSSRGIDQWSILFALGLLTLILLLIGVGERLSAVRQVTTSGEKLRFYHLPVLRWRLHLPVALLAGTICFLVFWIVLAPTQDSLMTEVYLLDEQNSAEIQPQQASYGVPTTTQLVIQNRTRLGQSHHIELWVENPWRGERQKIESFAVAIAPEETVQLPLVWTMPWRGEQQKVEILLYAQDRLTHQLHLWVDVE